MLELAAAFLVAVLVGGRAGWDISHIAAATAAMWPLLYLASCARWPHRECPWPWCPKRSPTAGNRGGSYRRRRACRVCGSRDYVRLGARLIGRGR